MAPFANTFTSHNMLPKFLAEQEAQGVKRDVARDEPNLFEQDRQADAIAIIKRVSAIATSMPNRAPPNDVIRETGSWTEGQPTDGHPANLDLHDIYPVHGEHVAEAARAADLPADTHSLGQTIQGFGAGMESAADPEWDATDLGNEIEILLSSNGAVQRNDTGDSHKQDSDANNEGYEELSCKGNKCGLPSSPRKRFIAQLRS